MKSNTRYALFSVNELNSIELFAATLIQKGWEIIATDKVCKFLREKGIPVISVHEYIGVEEGYNFPFPPTMHPKVEAALTQKEFSEKIDMVYDITYGPVEGMDVGGNALLSMAIKGDRIPVTSVKSMRNIVNVIAEEGEVSVHMRKDLQMMAGKEIAGYYCHIAESLSQNKIKYFCAEFYSKLLNGENPYQTADVWHLNKTTDPLAMTKYELISKNKPCYTNIVDLDSLTEVMSRIICAFHINVNKAPYVTLASKHGNVCGVGVDYESEAESIRKALWGNPRAVWGGELMVNFNITEKVANDLLSSERRKDLFGSGKWMLDVIAAPAYDQQALTILNQRRNTKIFVNQGLYKPVLMSEEYVYRFTRGSMVRQSKPDYVLDCSKLDWVIPMKNCELFDDLIIAWATAYTSFHGGNEVALSKGGQLLGCAGGPSTVEAVETLVSRVMKTHGGFEGAVFAADAFFPFTDAPEILVNAKVIGGTVPAGGLHYKEVKEYFCGNKILVGFIPEEFRGFCRH